MATEIENKDEFDFKTLQNQTKEELERIKLAKEIANFDEAKKFERRKGRGETIRIFVLALLSSVITLGTTYIFKIWDSKNQLADEKIKQQYALAQEARKELHDDLSKYNSSKDSSTEEYKWACTIGNLDNPDSSSFSDSVIKRYKSICETQPIIQGNYSNIINIVKQADSSHKKQDVSNYKEYSSIVDSLTNLKQAKSQDNEVLTNQIKAYQAKLDTLSKRSEDIQSIIAANKEINTNVKYQINSIQKTDTNNIAKDYGTLWFKTGYFLQFDDMRVLLQYLDKQLGIQVQICKTTGTEICSSKNAIVTQQWISYNRPLTIAVGNSNYKISLQTIDHAGNNPFKLAAYINVVKIGQ